MDDFQFSFFRTNGLTSGEEALLIDAHNYFLLPYDPSGEGKIAGVLLFPNGQSYIFVSGRHGGPLGGTQTGFVPRGAGSGINRFTVTHIEGHAAATLHRISGEVMSAEKMGEAALLIPKAPCGACDPNLPNMLPRGSRLFVVDPQTTTVYQSPSGFALDGRRFARRTDHFGGGVGVRSGAGNVALIGLQVMVDGIRDENVQRAKREKLDALQADIRSRLPGLMKDAMEIQLEGHQPRVNVVIAVEKTRKFTDLSAPTPLAPPRFDSYYEFKVESIKVSRETVELGGEDDEQYGDLPINPLADQKSKFRMTRSFDWSMPGDQLDQYDEFRMRMLWFDELAMYSTRSTEDLARLKTEQFWTNVIFTQAIAKWTEEVTKAPKPPFHAAPAPGAFLRMMPPPSPPFSQPVFPKEPPAPPSEPASSAEPAPSAKPASPAKPGYDIKAIAMKVYNAMGPGTRVLTYREILHRSKMNMDDIILGLEELQKTKKAVLIHQRGDINIQQAYRTQ